MLDIAKATRRYSAVRKVLAPSSLLSTTCWRIEAIISVEGDYIKLVVILCASISTVFIAFGLLSPNLIYNYLVYYQ